jgi:predicted transcriptional regulator
MTAFSGLFISAEKPAQRGEYVVALAFCTIITALAGFLIWYGLKNFKALTWRLTEKKVLDLVKKHEGRITPMEIAQEAEMEIEAAQAAIDKMCQKGYGQLEVTQKGNKVYVFAGFVDEDEKKTATDALA